MSRGTVHSEWDKVNRRVNVIVVHVESPYTQTWILYSVTTVFMKRIVKVKHIYVKYKTF